MYRCSVMAVRMRTTFSLALLVAVCGLGSAGWTDDAAPENTQNWAATVETIMEQAVRNIALRYNLNDEQTGYTHELMRREVTRFLKEHEDQVWPVIRDLITAQFKPPGDKSKVMQIGKAAQPLATLAEKAIFDANEEWRHILTPQQKRKHDFDLDEMRKTFTKIHGNFDQWAKGVPSDGGIFPPAKIPPGDPPRPPRPPRGIHPVVESIDISIFDTYVEEFIKDFELDEGQVDSARSILQEFKTKANNIRSAKKHEFEKVAADLTEAINKRSPEGIRKADAGRRKLLAFVHELFKQMDVRLKGLLTTAQKEKHPDRLASAEGKPRADDSKPKAPGAKSGDGESKPKPPAIKKKQPSPKKPAAKAKEGKSSGADPRGDDH